MSAEESALLDALRRGDEGAFARLVGEHHAGLRRVARLYVANASIADEVVQEVFLIVQRRLPEWRADAKITTWLYRITERVVHRQRRKQRMGRWLRGQRRPCKRRSVEQQMR